MSIDAVRNRIVVFDAFSRDTALRAKTREFNGGHAIDAR
jgi:hypothetical protein